MNNAITTPSLRSRAFAAFARWTWRLLLLVFVTLCLVWGGLHFVIVPRIAQWRPWLEQQATQALGIPVRIGAIEAKSNGLIPSIELKAVRFLDAQGRDALLLPSVLAALSPRSVLRLGFEQLYVEGPELDIRRSKDGRLWIAGMALPDTPGGDSSGVDWVFSQTELALRHGKIRWTDETRDLPPVQLDDVDLVIRNRLHRHNLRFDANPPPGWGQRFTLMGQFKQSLLSRHQGRWRDWVGKLYAQADEIDVAQLHNYTGLGVQLSEGKGMLRAWVDVDHARVTGATGDVVLRQIVTKATPELEALDVSQLSARLGFHPLKGGMEYSAQNLFFETRDGLRWPGGQVRLALFDAVAAPTPKAAPDTTGRGELSVERIDLASATEIARRLPLAEPLRKRLTALQARGHVDNLQLAWQGDPLTSGHFAAKGRVTALQLAAVTRGENPSPGVRGADIDFDVNQAGGKLGIAITKGALELPDVYDDPHIALDSLTAQVQWTLQAGQLAVQADKLQFANADAQGEAQIRWQGMAGPGVLDLQANLSRVEVASLSRYLPKAMHKPAREYLHDALLDGTADNVVFKVKGDLAKFPFRDSRQGVFHISADFKNVTAAFVPARLLPKESLQWPMLKQGSGELVQDYDRLQIKVAKAGVVGSPGLQIAKGEATISNIFEDSLVAVNLDAQGPLAEALALVNNSPVSVHMGKFLAQTTATGNANYKLKLLVPVNHAENTTVQGQVILAGNDLQLTPDLPRMLRTRGQLAYTESSFSVYGVQAKALGGEVRVDGGLSFAGVPTAPATPTSTNTSTTTIAGAANRPPPNVLRLQGTASAEGLRAARELGVLARIGAFTSGTTGYNATIGLRSGHPELLVTSNLAGMAINLPAPFAKAADTPLALRYENALVPGTDAPGAKLQDTLQVDLGRLTSVRYVRDISGTESRVLRGAVGTGLAADESAPLPADGVAANINVGSIDVDAWIRVLSMVGGDPGSAVPEPLASGNSPADAPTAIAQAATISASALAWLPTTLAIRAKDLQVAGRSLHNIVVGGARQGGLWRANVTANELNGYVEYRQSQPAVQGRVFARLAHLNLEPAVAQDVESLLDSQPASIPALDIVVEDLVLRGKKLGRLELLATNKASASVREPSRIWELDRFNITMPMASFTASGSWADVGSGAGNAPVAGGHAPRLTDLRFVFDIANSGDLLTSLGMPGVIAKGKGKIEGTVNWRGSPTAVDYASMNGDLTIDIEKGQFLKADPGIAKLLGVLSLQSLPRRLTLDFSDVFSEGFAFDSVRGNVKIERAVATTSNLQMRGVSAAVFMDGQANIEKETQHINVVVVPEINAGSASLLASVVNPFIGITTFLAQAILRGPLINSNTQQFLIDGTWLDPKVTKVDTRGSTKTDPKADPKIDKK